MHLPPCTPVTVTVTVTVSVRGCHVVIVDMVEICLVLPYTVDTLFSFFFFGGGCCCLFNHWPRRYRVHEQSKLYEGTFTPEVEAKKKFMEELVKPLKFYPVVYLFM